MANLLNSTTAFPAVPADALLEATNALLTHDEECNPSDVVVAAGTPTDSKTRQAVETLGHKENLRPKMPKEDQRYIPITWFIYKAQTCIDILQISGVRELIVPWLHFRNGSVIEVQHPNDASATLYAEEMPSIPALALVNYYKYHAKILHFKHQHISGIIGFSRSTSGEPALLFPRTDDLPFGEHLLIRPVSMVERLKYMHDTLFALKYMHKGSGDIKVAKGIFTENSIFVDRNNKAYFSNHWRYLADLRKCWSWEVAIPPECDAKGVRPDEWFGDYGRSSVDVQLQGDMWYFGLLLLRTTDYSNWANDVRRFREGDRPDCQNGLDKEMWDVIFDRFLDMDPSKRITAEDAIPILRKLINRAADESFQPTIDALEVVRASC